MALEFTTSYLRDSVGVFRYYKTLAERAMAQVSDEQLFTTLDDESNSIAIVVKHMSGNMRSRWTDSTCIVRSTANSRPAACSPTLRARFAGSRQR